MKIEPQYSGKKSTSFWREVRRLKNKGDHDAAYAAGVLLQNLERTVLEWVNHWPKKRERP